MKITVKESNIKKMAEVHQPQIIQTDIVIKIHKMVSYH
jgi:hypothetical protein